jgi:hypothetical protein
VYYFHNTRIGVHFRLIRARASGLARAGRSALFRAGRQSMATRYLIGLSALALAVAALPAPAFAQFGGSPDAQVDYPGDPNAPGAGTRPASPESDSAAADAEDVADAAPEDGVYAGVKPGPDQAVIPDDEADEPYDESQGAYDDAYGPDDERMTDDSGQTYVGTKPDQGDPGGPKV